MDFGRREASSAPYVSYLVKSCIQCAFKKQPSGTREGEYHYGEIDNVLFKTVHLDHFAPFSKSSKRNEYVLLLVDAFMKYIIIWAVPNTATKYVD